MCLFFILRLVGIKLDALKLCLKAILPQAFHRVDDKSFRFLDRPIEIRLRIYKLFSQSNNIVIGSARDLTCDDWAEGLPVNSMALIKANKLLHAKATPVLLSLSKFIVAKDVPAAEQSMDVLSPKILQVPALARIRNLEYVVELDENPRKSASDLFIELSHRAWRLQSVTIDCRKNGHFPDLLAMLCHYMFLGCTTSLKVVVELYRLEIFVLYPYQVMGPNGVGGREESFANNYIWRGKHINQHDHNNHNFPPHCHSKSPSHFPKALATVTIRAEMEKAEVVLLAATKKDRWGWVEKPPARGADTPAPGGQCRRLVWTEGAGNPTANPTETETAGTR